MSLPIVAIVGRPNVGKSSLLNMLARRRISIVDPTPGVTRDRVGAVCEVDDRYFELLDTGGYGIEDVDDLTAHVEDQIVLAIAGAALILFVVDIREGVTPLDQEVARLLRGAEAPVVLVANKADIERHEDQAGVLCALGFGEPICVSAHHGRRRRELLALVGRHLGSLAAEEAPEPVMKVALVGRRNVGKSTFINALAGQDRVIVSEVPGTTRDSVDVRFDLDGRQVLAIDTAGLRKRRKWKTGIDCYGHLRVLASIRRADVILFLVDATESTGEVDKKLARLLMDAFKPCVIVVNKWDLAKGRADAEDYGTYLARTMPQMSHAPLAFTTAMEGRNVRSTIELAQSLYRQARTRVTTGQLNRAIDATLAGRQPMATKQGGQPKIYYATQVSVCPPTVVLFVNNPAMIREQYRRYTEKRIRELLPFDEVPVRLLWRARRSQQGARGSGRDRDA